MFIRRTQIILVGIVVVALAAGTAILFLKSSDGSREAESISTKQSTQEDDYFKMQEKCLVLSKQLVEMENDKYSDDVRNFESHFNKKLHKCFAVLTYESIIGWKLFDVLENRPIAELSIHINSSDGTSIISCFRPPNLEYVENQDCNYDTYVKPYMTE